MSWDSLTKVLDKIYDYGSINRSSSYYSSQRTFSHCLFIQNENLNWTARSDVSSKQKGHYFFLVENGYGWVVASFISSPILWHFQKYCREREASDLTIELLLIANRSDYNRSPILPLFFEKLKPAPLNEMKISGFHSHTKYRCGISFAVLKRNSGVHV